MKLKIFGEKEKEDVLRLKLERCINDKEIMLIAVDERGGRLAKGSILGITADGCVELYSNIDASLGLKLDEQGRIEVENALTAQQYMRRMSARLSRQKK